MTIICRGRQEVHFNYRGNDIILFKCNNKIYYSELRSGGLDYYKIEMKETDLKKLPSSLNDLTFCVFTEISEDTVQLEVAPNLDFLKERIREFKKNLTKGNL